MVASVMTIRSALLLLFSALPVAAWAQVLTDPTRPPMEIGDGSGAASVHAAPAVPKGLLSVIISPSRCAAIIDGKTIALGEKYGDATIVEITARGVVLQGVRGRRSMELFPGVALKVTAAQPASPIMCVLENKKTETKKVPRKSPRQIGLEEKK